MSVASTYLVPLWRERHCFEGRYTDFLLFICFGGHHDDIYSACRALQHILIAGAAMPPLTLAKCCGVWHAEAILSLFSIGRVRCDLERADAGQCLQLAASMGWHLQGPQTHGWCRMETKLTDPWRPHNVAVEGGSRVCCLGSSAALLCRSERLQLFHHSEHTNKLYFAGHSHAGRCSELDLVMGRPQASED